MSINKAVSLLLAAVLASCSKSSPPREATAAGSPPPSVAVAKVTREDLAENFVLSAAFRPYQDTDLHAKVAGYLRRLHVDVGDRVKAGQLLAELEVPEMGQEVLQANALRKRTELDVARTRSELTRAETNVRIREISYNRLSSVAKQRPNLVAQQELDNSLALLQDAQAQVATAKAALAAVEGQVQVSESSAEKAGMMMSYLRITAPFSGVITHRYVSPGALIQAGTASASRPVVRIAQVDKLRLTLPIPESIVSRIRVGTPVSVRVDGREEGITGRVSRFSSELSAATRSMETEVDVPNPDGSLLPGMYAYATLQLSRRGEALAVPMQALSGAEREQTLYVVNGRNTIEARKVRFGLDTPEKYEVLSGLAEGELVMIGSRGQIKPGDTVTPRLLQ